MVHESDAVSAWRNPNVADPSTALVKDLADRIFEPALTSHVVNHGQTAFFAPIGPPNIRKHLFGSAAGHTPGGHHAVATPQLPRLRTPHHHPPFITAGDPPHHPLAQFPPSPIHPITYR